MPPKLFSRFCRRPATARLIGKADIAQLFGVSTDVIDLWLKHGKLPKGKRRFGFRRWDYVTIAALRKNRRAD